MTKTKKFCVAILVVLSSIYLTFLVDTFTLNTVAKRLFIFFYFIVICMLLLWLKTHLKTYVCNRKTVLCAMAGAIVLLCVFQSHFLPLQQEVTVYLYEADANADATGREVWLTNIKVDGKDILLSQLLTECSGGWEYHLDYDDYVFYPSENENNLISFSVVGKELELTFGQNNWSGTVHVIVEGQEERIFDLYSNDTEQDRVISTWQTMRSYSLVERVILNSGIFVILVFLLNICISFFAYHMGGKNRKEGSEKTKIGKIDSKVMFIVAYIVNAGLLFYTSEKITLAPSMQITLFIITSVTIIFAYMNWESGYVKKYREKGSYFAILLIAMYSSFAAFGHDLFLNGNMRPTCSALDMFYYFAGVFWFLPIIVSLLISVEKISLIQKNIVEKNSQKRLKSFFILFGILCLVQLIIIYSFWPGGFPSDTLYQLNQAILGTQLDDWHPVLHTLLFRLLYNIIPNPGIIMLTQVAIFTLLCTMILMVGYDSGISLVKLCTIGVVFLILPNQVILEIGVVKDFPYTLALLWGTYLLFRLVLDKAICKKLWFIGCFAIDLFLIYGLRHNGIIPVLFMILLCAFVTKKYWKQVKLYLMVPVLIAVTCIAIYKGPVFYMLDVKENTVSPYTTMFCAVGSCVNKGLPLSEESNEILKSIIPMEDWANYYSRFEGHDKYIWGRSETSFNLSNVTAKDAFRVYLEALLRYPDVVIKDRFDGMNILWNLKQPVDGFNGRGFDAVYNFDFTGEIFDVTKLCQYPENGHYYNNSTVANLYRGVLYRSGTGILDMIIWRPGIYVILFFILVLYWCKNNLQQMVWVAIPMLGNIAGSLLVLYHQSFRYVYFVQLITLTLLFLTVCISQEVGREKIDQEHARNNMKRRSKK